MTILLICCYFLARQLFFSCLLFSVTYLYKFASIIILRTALIETFFSYDPRPPSQENSFGLRCIFGCDLLNIQLHLGFKAYFFSEILL